MTWKLTNARIRKAEELGEELAGLQETREPPVDPFALAKSERPLLKVISGDFEDAFDGQLEYHRTRNRFLLFLNAKYDDAAIGSGQRHPRTRFSIGHELGHYFIETHRAYLMGGGKPHGSRSEFRSAEIIEREADAFSAGLLMPRHLIRRLINQDELTFDRIVELAGSFQTSVVSTAIRSVRLSDFPCGIAGIRDGAITWVFASEPLIEAGCYPGERGPIGSRTAVSKWEEFRLGVLDRTQAEGRVCNWFRTYDRHDLEELYLTEEYFPVSVMDTLLVLLTVSEDDLLGTDN